MSFLQTETPPTPKYPTTFLSHIQDLKNPEPIITLTDPNPFPDSLRLLEIFAKANRQSSLSEIPQPSTLNPQLSPHLMYLDRFFQQQEYSSWEAKASVLRADYEQLIRETILIEPTTKYSYWVDIEQKKMTGSGYSEGMELMHGNFAQIMVDKGLSSSRAIVEYFIFEKIKHKLFQSARNKIDGGRQFAFLVSSPPDSQKAGYHGADSLKNWQAKESHHSFFYLMRVGKIESAPNISHPAENPSIKRFEIKVTQLRGWPNIAELIALHQKLGAGFIPNKNEPITNQIIANTISFEISASTPFSRLLNQIKNQVYANTHQWKYRPQQAPKIEARFLEAFWQQEWPILLNEIYTKPVLSFYQQIDKNRLQSREYLLWVEKQLEFYHAFFISLIERRVRQLNSNPAYEQLIRRQIVWQSIRRPWLAPQLLKQLSLDESPQEIETQTYLTKVDNTISVQRILARKSQGDHISESDKNFLQSANLSSLISFTNSVFGAAQCYPVAILKLPQQLLKTPGLNNVLGSTSLEQLVQKISLEEKQHLLKQLTEIEYIELDLTAKGANRIWMIPKNYLTAPGCRIDKKGEVIGPCGLPLNDPQETLALAMDKREYLQLINKLRQEDHQEKLLNLDEFIKNSNSKLDKNQVIQAEQLLIKLQNIIMPPSIGIQQLIDGEFLSQTAKIVLNDEDYNFIKSAVGEEIISRLKEIIEKYLGFNKDTQSSPPNPLKNIILN